MGHPCCFRVALQYEFTKLHLDDVLERLKNHESEELAVQISAYVDNEFDIAVLMEEAEEKVAAMERVADLEDEVGRLNETMQELEVNAMATQVCSACGAKIYACSSIPILKSAAFSSSIASGNPT